MSLAPWLSSARFWALACCAFALVFAAVSHANAPAGRYTAASGVVTDNLTGLVWQQTDDGNTYTYAAATQFCVDRGGAWRLPSMKELQTIVDESRSLPAVDTTAFPDAPSGSPGRGLGSCLWTSSLLAGTSNAWLVCFDEGRPTYDNANDAYKVLCVR